MFVCDTEFSFNDERSIKVMNEGKGERCIREAFGI